MRCTGEKRSETVSVSQLPVGVGVRFFSDRGLIKNARYSKKFQNVENVRARVTYVEKPST